MYKTLNSLDSVNSEKKEISFYDTIESRLKESKQTDTQIALQNILDEFDANCVKESTAYAVEKKTMEHDYAMREMVAYNEHSEVVRKLTLEKNNKLAELYRSVENGKDS